MKLKSMKTWLYWEFHKTIDRNLNPMFVLHSLWAIPLVTMSAVDGWVNDVDDVLSKAEHSYRQITEDTTVDEKRMLLTDAKRLVGFSGRVFMDRWMKQRTISTLWRSKLRNFPVNSRLVILMYFATMILRYGIEEDCLFGENQSSAVRTEISIPVNGAKGFAGSQ